MPNQLPVLIICFDAVSRDRMSDFIRGFALRPVLCPTLTDARSLIEREKFPLILCSDDLPDAGLETSLEILSASPGSTPVIAISRVADWDACLAALNAGAFDYIAWPPHPNEAKRILNAAMSWNPQPLRASPAAA